MPLLQTARRRPAGAASGGSQNSPLATRERVIQFRPPAGRVHRPDDRPASRQVHWPPARVSAPSKEEPLVAAQPSATRRRSVLVVDSRRPGPHQPSSGRLVVRSLGAARARAPRESPDNPPDRPRVADRGGPNRRSGQPTGESHEPQHSSEEVSSTRGRPRRGFASLSLLTRTSRELRRPAAGQTAGRHLFLLPPRH